MLRINRSAILLIVLLIVVPTLALGQASITSFTVSGTAIRNSDTYASGLVRLHNSKSALISTGDFYTTFECDLPAVRTTSPDPGCTIPTGGSSEGEFEISVKFYVGGGETGQGGSFNAGAAIYSSFGTNWVYSPLSYSSASYSLSVSPSTVYTDAVTKRTWGTLTRSVPPRTNQAASVQVFYSPKIVVINNDSFLDDDFAAVSIASGNTSTQFPIDYGVVAQPTTVNLTALNASGSLSINPPPTSSDPHPDSGPCKQCEARAGEPINVTNGNTWVQQADFSLPGLAGGLSLVRTWNSLWQTNSPVEVSGMFGHSWRSNFEARLQIFTDYVKYWQGDGTVWTFNYNSVTGTYYLAEPKDERAALTYDASSSLFTVTLHNKTKFVFKSNGYFDRFVDRNGNQTVATYDASDRLTKITDPAGREMTFAYTNASFPRAATSVTVAGATNTYLYDGSGRLQQTTYADSTHVSFTYDAQHLLLSVLDNESKVLEAHTYDSQRRGLTSERAGGVDRVTVTYAQTGLTRVTDSKGNFTDYAYELIGKRRFIDSTNGPGCASCGGRGVNAYTYDAQGNRTSATDALNRKTTYTYDADGSVTSVTPPH